MAAEHASTAAAPGSAGAPGERLPADRLWVEMRSPDGPIFSGWAQSITVPARKGGMGVLPRHAPLMSALDVGLTRVTEPGGKEHRFVTGAGFVEIEANRVLLLVDFGERT